MPRSSAPIVVAHLDESCLGNGRDSDNRGGAGGLIETRTASGIQRRDFWISDPATTNNRMALEGAATLLELLAARGARLRVLVVSDSEYLVRGICEWVPGWISRGWRRKRGPIENLERWQRLVRAAQLHDVHWNWVRGHFGHAKNEYADHLAVQAARLQTRSDGAVPSGFEAWLEAKRKKRQYLTYDPDQSFTETEAQLA
ncbi:MAG TPA: ribonuclease H [Gemmatimonadales bacterium]|nr:ribonuclease H [Gemmatimonadales bacterium]